MQGLNELPIKRDISCYLWNYMIQNLFDGRFQKSR